MHVISSPHLQTQEEGSVKPPRFEAKTHSFSGLLEFCSLSQEVSEPKNTPSNDWQSTCKCSHSTNDKLVFIVQQSGRATSTTGDVAGLCFSYQRSTLALRSILATQVKAYSLQPTSQCSYRHIGLWYHILPALIPQPKRPGAC